MQFILRSQCPKKFHNLFSALFHPQATSLPNDKIHSPLAATPPTPVHTEALPPTGPCAPTAPRQAPPPPSSSATPAAPTTQRRTQTASARCRGLLANCALSTRVREKTACWSKLARQWLRPGVIWYLATDNDPFVCGRGPRVRAIPERDLCHLEAAMYGAALHQLEPQAWMLSI